MEQQVRYCTTEDGVRIAYNVNGDGPPLICCPYFFESLALGDSQPTWQAYTQQIGAGRQVIRFDARGTGLSQRQVDDVSHHTLIRDIDAVVLATRLKRFALWGSLLSGPSAIEYAAGHPRKVSHLILYGTFARSTDLMTAENLQSLAALCRSNWALAAQVFADMSARQEHAEEGLRLAEGIKQSMEGDVLARALLSFPDVGDSLARVKSPTLILHRTQDSAVPFTTSQELASRIPNARLVPLNGAVNFPALGDSQSIIDAVDAFLTESEEKASEPATEAAGAFRTIFFTDVEGSTALTQRLGDAKARELLREHERIVREALKSHGGAELKTMGDGFMASFSSATRALESAIAMQRAFAAHNESAEEPIMVRVGLNAGEPIAEDEDLFGTAVIMAARIAAQAQGGEILASDVVRQLVAGKRFLFSDRGEVALRGFDEPVHLYEVRWQEQPGSTSRA
jgi:class 3 adenylate cyclase/pimeloyl-ACP methyl ester carboxylesterase